MSVTYPHDRPQPQGDYLESPREEPFVPVYARTRRNTRSRKSGVKTWMILAPIGVLVLGAGAAAMLMGGGDEVAPAPLAEPAATAPVVPAQPLLTEAEPAATAAAPVVDATPAPAPAVRRTAPAPTRRAAATSRAPAAAPAPAPRVVVPVQPTAPQPYTATLNTAPTTPAPAQPPVIVIQPAD
ncbi:hypothetical protein [Brevundimonas sp.]|uniref:hypothetical protein n=1 Tax=Brevundimonas sp. TaxID=1871086 RepID=UPI002D507B9F|nr:hypothetical protein [Brevundimonas sp.]HYC67067.1 hypothetical protein [Brevundimonas sp.]